MLGRLIISEPPVHRWGDGSDGDATWSNNNQVNNGNWYDGVANCKRILKNGFYQFNTLTISSGTHVEVTLAAGASLQKLIIFCKRELIVGDNVQINAGYNNFHKNGTNWTAPDHENALADSNTIFATGGGGGGGGGINEALTGGMRGYNADQTPALYYSTNRGTGKGDFIEIDGRYLAKGGADKRDGSGQYGGNGWPASTAQINSLMNACKDNFNFTTELKGANNHDDYPVWNGGRGGNSDDTYESRNAYAGHGGRGGGTIVIVAPKVTFGTGCKIRFEGNRANYGSGKSTAGGKNMSADRITTNRGYGGGTGAGGAGGGGFFGIVTTRAGWHHDANNGFNPIGNERSHGGYGCDSSGNVRGYKSRGSDAGAAGGTGGCGIYLRGYKPFLGGSTEEVEWATEKQEESIIAG